MRLTTVTIVLTNYLLLPLDHIASQPCKQSSYFTHPPGWASRGVPQSDTEGLADWDPEWSAQPYPISRNP